MHLAQLHREDRGSVAILVTISLLVLLGFAALVVDVGAGYSERRLDQAVADIAVMGAAVHGLNVSSATAGALEAQRLVDENLDRTLPATDWEKPNCEDADAYAIQPLPNVECISFNETGTRIRVKLPDQIVDTTFGRLSGVNSIDVSAFAEASVDGLGAGGALPYGLWSNQNAGTEACLKDTAGPLDPPCDGPTEGQFGAYDPYKYEPGTKFCSSDNDVFKYSVRFGIDHPMTSYEPDYVVGNPETLEQCTMGNNPTLYPNTVIAPSAGGNKVSVLVDGLIKGHPTLFGGFDGRLEDGSPGAVTIDWQGGSPDDLVNSEPLWDYLVNPSTCRTDVLLLAPDLDLMKAELLDCITNWIDADGPLFREGLNTSTRFAFVPKYSETAVASKYHINSFVPVYVQGLYLSQSGGPGPPFIFEPGMTGTISDVQQLRALTAIVLDCRMLSDSPCDPESDTTPPGADDLNTLKLSK